MYEPYVILRWCPSSASLRETTAKESHGDSMNLVPIAPVAPYYDERFLGYGHNKIQFMAHIRWMGYQFVVIPKGGFLVHSPHVMSSQKSIWLDGENELRRNNTDLFDAFINELDSIYGQATLEINEETGDRVYPRECLKTNTTTAIDIDGIQLFNETRLWEMHSVMEWYKYLDFRTREAASKI